MSDCFDHEVDAFDSKDREYEYCGYGLNGNAEDIKLPNPFIQHTAKRRKPNHLYHHTLVNFDALLTPSEKCHRMVINGNKYWIPKKYVKNLI